jgi:two-component system cell cycle response regulator
MTRERERGTPSRSQRSAAVRSSTERARRAALPATARRPVLFVLQGPEQGSVLTIPDRGALIGRDGTADIKLGDEAISRQHARILIQDGEAYVEDLASLNGTYVNQRRIGERVRLSDGDYVSFGRITIAKYTRMGELEQQTLRTLFELTLRDPMTELYNRRYFDDRLKSEFSYAIRRGTQLALLMIDIDHFKRVNDSLGHPAGDLVLKLIAATLRKMMRPEDVLARYGGEEFVVIARSTSLRNAEILGERIRRRIAELPLPPALCELRITVSVGVAGIGAGGPYASAEALVAAVDDALYRAKNTGRNRVCALRPPVTTLPDALRPLGETGPARA